MTQPLKMILIGAALSAGACQHHDRTSGTKLLASYEERVRSVVETLASDAFEGRLAGTSGYAKTVAYLESWMSAQNLEPRGTAEGTFTQPFAEGANLIGLLNGTGDPSAKPAVIISAHLDGLGSACSSRNIPASSPVCNGASDDAGGVAAVIAAVEFLQGKTSMPVAVVFFDAEEKGLLGSKEFVEHPTFDLAGVRLLINLDIVGLNLFRGLETAHFMIGAETGGAALEQDARDSASASGLDVGATSYAFGHRRSDVTSFVEAGVRIPAVFFSDGDGSVYHTPADEIGAMNFPKVAAVAKAGADLALRADTGGDRYVPTPPVSQSGVYLPRYEDTAPLLNLVKKCFANAAENRLSESQVGDLSQYKQRLDAIVAAGAGAFPPESAVVLGTIARKVLTMSQNLDFAP